jgi:hypothetical protein
MHALLAESSLEEHQRELVTRLFSAFGNASWVETGGLLDVFLLPFPITVPLTIICSAKRLPLLE